MDPPEYERPERLLSEMGWLDSLARAMVREPELAQDVAQETYLTALEHGSDLRGNLRAWLATVARNVARKARRGDVRRRDREVEWLSTRPTEVSAEEAESRFALRHDLSRAVNELDEGLRQVLLLRFVHDLSLREVAERVGAPLSTVDGRIQRALGILRARLDRDRDFDRRARAMLGLPVAGARPRPPRVPPRAAAWIGGAGGLALILVATVPGTRDREAPSTVERSARIPANGPQLSALESEARGAVRRIPLSEDGEAPPAGPGRGSIAVRVRDATGQAVEGVWFRPRPVETGRRAPLPVGARTDAEGRARFLDLSAGAYRLTSDRLSALEVLVEAAEVTSLTRQLDGPALGGVVVDRAGRPVADAVVWTSALPGGWLQDETWVIAEVEEVPVARTDHEGRFSIACAGDARLVGARAPRFAPSDPLRLRDVSGRLGELEITLPGPGAEVAGRATGPGGEPLVGAEVFLGTGFAEETGTGPLRSTTTSLAGEFRFAGVAPGMCRLEIHGRGLAPWRGKVEVAESGDTFVLPRLGTGVAVTGVVYDDRGAPVVGAEVFVARARWQRAPGLRHGRVGHTDNEGLFTVAGVEAGAELWLTVLSQSGARHVQQVTAPARVDVSLAPVASVRGRVVDTDGAGIAGCSVQVGATAAARASYARTDEEGAFEVALSSPPGQQLRIYEREALVYSAEVSPQDGLVVVLAADERPTATIRGHLLPSPGPSSGPQLPELRHLELVDRADGRTFRVRLALEADGFVSLPVVPGLYGIRLVAADAQLELPGDWELMRGTQLDLGALALEPDVPVELSFRGDEPLRDLRLWIRNDLGELVHDDFRAGPESDPTVRVRLPGGLYSLFVTSASTLPERRDLRVESGGAAPQALALGAGVPVELLFRPPGGERVLASLRLAVERRGAPRDELVLDVPITPSFRRPDGAYRLALGLAPGEYRLSARVRQLRAEGGFSVSASGSPRTLEFELE